MLIEGQKVIDIIEGHKGFGINGILENIVEDIDNLCSDWEKMGLNINRRDDMTLDDAIIHAEEVANSKCDKCGAEHRQLAEWLKDYKRLLEQEPCEDCISRQAVLDELDNHRYSNEFCEEYHIDWSINLGMAHIVINGLPSVNPQEPKMDILDKIRAIVKEWKDDSWTDGLSYECMVKISELFTESEG